MDKQAISSSLYLILALSLLTSVDSNLLLTLCQSNRTISSTAFEQNLNLLLKNLTVQTALSNGFFSTSIGDDRDKVNGKALCRWDVNATDCQKCLESASQEIIKCRKEEAITWYEACQIHYASREFFNLMTYAGQVPDERYYSRGNVSRGNEFGEKLRNLIKELLNEDGLSNSKIMFATREIHYSKNESIYGLVQCTRDVDVSQCKICLASAWGDLEPRSSFKKGGILLSDWCNMRFEVSPFYNTTSSPKGHKWKKWKVVAVASTASSAVVILICSLVVHLLWNKGARQESAILNSLPSPGVIHSASNGDEFVNTEELPLMDLSTISAATHEFSDLNRLGQGGFGTVYKGILPDGKEVAVKRLSTKSWQGMEEFKNELVLIAKLQHRNLVRLLGCAMEGEEKLLIYEFMPNKSLDRFIFDSEKRSLLDWKTRYNIICGIARGLLYLHEDSRLKIVHRDLKPSNVLLDAEMVAKISDFGLARIFCDDQNAASTRKVVGTYGYMAPEYAMEGQFSVKSDVFSFGVILLEIISGRKNNSIENSQTLIRYAWQHWKEEKGLEFVDPLMAESDPVEEVLRCMHIGLLCVQADPADRPTMSSVMVLLESGLVSLPHPSQPAFCVPKVVPITQSSLTKNSLSGLTASCTLSSSTCP